MNSFVNAVNTPNPTQTTNGMLALDKTGNALVDLFFKIGAARNMPVSELQTLFARALGEDKILATKILLWARDVRGGAGERKVFRDLMKLMEKNYPEVTIKLLPHISEFGRWDDLLIFETEKVQNAALNVYALALRSGDGLAAKWAPRKGLISAKLRNVMGMSPKAFRKMLVNMTNVVEQKMCAGDWSNIEFGKLPSIASKQYQKAFGRHAPDQYSAYIESLKKGEAKINAGAIFPHDVIVGLKNGNIDVAEKQWEALPNYMGNVKLLPMIDVSGSMESKAGKSNVSCMDIAVALGLYISEKNPGAYNGVVLTFTDVPEIMQLKGSLRDRVIQIKRRVGYNTNLEAAYNATLNMALKNNVNADDMPEFIVMLSDCQFDSVVRGPNVRAVDMIREKFEAAGYKMPKVVFWNLNAYDNVPASYNEAGVMMISGFSPAILHSVLSATKITPFDLMMDTIGKERYNVNVW